MFSFELGFGLWKIGGDVGVEILERGLLVPTGFSFMSVASYVTDNMCGE